MKHLFYALPITLLILIILYKISIFEHEKSVENLNNQYQFEGFNNVTGTKDGCYIVPNYVHFLRFSKPALTFVEAVCLIAAFKHQRPTRIYIHANVPQSGKYWNVVKTVPGLWETLFFRNITLPREIFGQVFKPAWRVYHASDVTRIRILIEFGGIFLDNDSYIVKSLDDFRRFEMAIGWYPGKSLQNQIIVAHKDARFLKLWLESYRDNYQPSNWYYNAGELPTKILDENPHLVHHVAKFFGGYGVFMKLYTANWVEWRKYYGIHLIIKDAITLKGSRKPPLPASFNESNIHKYNITLRSMVYEVYPFKSQKRD